MIKRKKSINPGQNQDAPGNKKRIAKIAIRWTGIILLILILSLFGLYAFLQRNPQALVDKYLGELAQTTGLEFTVGAVDVTLLPLPSLALSDVRVKGKDLSIRFAWAQITPSFAHIFSGHFFPGAITILRPRIYLATSLPLDQPEKIFDIFKNMKGGGEFKIPPADFHILDLGLIIKDKTGGRLDLAGLDAQFSTWPRNGINGEARFSRFSFIKQKTRIFNFEKCDISAVTNLEDFLGNTPRIKISGHGAWNKIIKNSVFEIEYESSDLGWSGHGGIKGRLDLPGAAIPFETKGRVASINPVEAIVLRGVEWRLGADSGGLDLTCKLASPSTPFSMQGTFIANRLSLTQWLGFARNLPPGLQLSLDNITSARAEFIIDAKGMNVPKIKADCAGASFTGSGSVPDWKKPSVNLDVVSPLVNLGRGLPEALAQTPDAPWFPHPPLTPMPGEPLKPGETGIDYQIRLAAKTLFYGPLKFTGASLHIHPGKLDTTGLQDVLLDGKANLYGGKVSGSCILGADRSLPYHISGKAANVDGAPLGKAMPQLPIRQGIYGATATVTSRGKKLDPFLANLKGKVSIKGEKARISSLDFTFDDLSSTSELVSASWNGKELAFNGKWGISARCQDWGGKGSLEGKLAFGEKGLTLNNMPASFSVETYNGLLPKNASPKISCRLSGNSGQNQFKFEKYTLEIAGIKFTGSAALDGNRESISGDFSTRLENPNAAAAKFGYKALQFPANFMPVNLNSNFNFQSNKLRLSKLNCDFGKTSLAGDVNWEIKNKRPFFDLNLNLGSIDIVKNGNGKETNSWNFPFMRTFDADASIKIAKLTAFETAFQNMQFKMKLKNGNLEINPLSANFYGAPLKGDINLDFNRGFGFKAITQVNAFNLEEAVKDHKTGISLKGQANLSANIAGLLTGKMKFAQALNGTWRIGVNSGSWQDQDKNGQLVGKPTAFDKLTANGSLESGVARSNNFTLTAPNLKVTGGGWFNLATTSMDCTFNVNMRGLPDFPIYVYGPAAKLQKRIGAGKMILNAVGGAASGFVNAIGGALKGAWNIFSK